MRFAWLNPSFYKGTFGRPDAKRVFFADYAQVSGKSLPQALIATGASTLVGNAGPSQAFFIWVYALDDNAKAAAASRHAVFEALQAGIASGHDRTAKSSSRWVWHPYRVDW